MTERDPRYAAGHDEAEISVLGAMLQDRQAVETACSTLKLEDFEHPSHRLIFAAIENLWGRGFESEPVAVRVELEADGLLEQAGGAEYLARIIDIVPTAANLPYHVARLREDAAKRQIKAAVEDVRQEIRRNGKPAAELHAYAVERFARCARPDSSPPVSTLADILADPEALKPPPEIVPRVACRQRVSMLAGREKDGKTTFLMAAAAAVTTGGDFLGEPCPQGIVLVVALDEHIHDTAQKLVRFAADPDRTLIITDLGADRIAGLRNVVRSCAPDLVIVDSLSRLTGGLIRDGGQAVQWAPHMAAIVAVARETHAGLVLVHHATKSGSGYRDSGEIGAAVDMILEATPGPDERSREIRAKGRWPLAGYTVRLNGDLDDPAAPLWYSLDAGELPLGVRVHVYVQRHPGCSKAQVRRGVSGRAQDVDLEINRLLERGIIANRGDEVRWQLEAAPQQIAWDAVRDAVDDPERVP